MYIVYDIIDIIAVRNEDIMLGFFVYFRRTLSLIFKHAYCLLSILQYIHSYGLWNIQ